MEISLRICMWILGLKGVEDLWYLHIPQTDPQKIIVVII